MNIIIFGPPGAGKGTQAQNIASRFHLHQVSTGDLLRNEIKKKTDIGKVIERIIAKGDFVTEGDIIGKMGSTGRAVGAHLHYEIKVNKKSVNPYNFISIGRELLSSSIIRN